MSFDLMLVNTEHGDAGLADRAAVQGVLRRYGLQDSSDDCYDAVFDDGSHVSFRACGLSGQEPFNTIAFQLRDFTHPMMCFIHEVALAGDFIILNMQGKDTETSASLLLVDEAQRAHLWEDAAKHPQLVTSGDQLGAALVGDAEGWRRYRDQVLSGS